MMANLKEILLPLLMLWKHTLFKVSGVSITLGSILVAMVLLLISPRLSRWVSRQINRRVIEPFVPDKSSQVTYQTFAYYVCLATVLALSLTIAGIPLTVFTFLGGALAIGVGFGSQNIVNNFISGMILLVEKPIKIGDVVELDNVSGTVLSIGTRSTRIKNIEGKIFIVPNSFFLEKTVLNWSYQSSKVRTTVTFGVAYGSDVEKVENICMDILLNTEGVEQNPLPLVIFENFSDSNLEFQLIFWCDLDQVSSLALVRSSVRFKIEKKFREHRIQMAFPQRDMNLKIDKMLEVKLVN